MAYTAVTLAMIRAELLDRVAAVPYWTDQEALHAINESLRWWNLFTGQWKARQTVVTVANQVWYSFSNSFVYNMRVEFNSVPMEPGSIFSLDQGRGNWEGETTASGGSVPTTPRVWAPAGLKMLAIWPADAAGGNTLTVDGVTTTPQLVNDSDTVDLNDSDHGPLLSFALRTLAFKEGGLRFSATAPLDKEFYTAIGQVNSRLSASAFFRNLMGLDLREQKMGLNPKEPS